MSAPEKLIDKVMHGDTVSTRDLAVAYVRYETLRKLNPRLICARLKGFGLTDSPTSPPHHSEHQIRNRRSSRDESR